ncbi:thioesterase family protein [Fulvivirga lutea]|uniref:Fluoroacetyl-CoA-specific thioesterase-like domain-containing protein n=1 Tax=Fulvivirga lutea TaxID=2810512 RepID=A0A974WFQ2_9BACT|nr:hypothetical protein [Fulvivirga lutea]QSE97155.1 hypothetical protein JR347_16410 [Fulvivirga lutea]
MLEGLKIGEKATVEYKVKPTDVPNFDGKDVHPVCSTYVLAREIEWSSRQFVLKYKLDDEEGIGTKLTIEHIGPAKVGELVSITAEAMEIKGNELICNYIAKVSDRIIAKGTTGQKVLKKNVIEKIFSKFDGND